MLTTTIKSVEPHGFIQPDFIANVHTEAIKLVMPTGAQQIDFAIENGEHIAMSGPYSLDFEHAMVQSVLPLVRYAPTNVTDSNLLITVDIRDVPVNTCQRLVGKKWHNDRYSILSVTDALPTEILPGEVSEKYAQTRNGLAVLLTREIGREFPKERDISDEELFEMGLGIETPQPLEVISFSPHVIHRSPNNMTGQAVARTHIDIQYVPQ